uniref:Uncharacterized protein n=1 Tax=Arundo donax TaxID=35708 RepID=A0A0A8Z9P8_ARUDO
MEDAAEYFLLVPFVQSLVAL